MRSRLRVPALAVVACLSIPGCAAQQSQASGTSRTQDAVRAQIEQGTARFAEVFNRGDIAAVAAMYDTGAVVLAPNAPVMRGRQNIESLWNGARQQGFRTLNLTVNSVEAAGITRSTRELHTRHPATGSGRGHDRGKYMVVWRPSGRVVEALSRHVQHEYAAR